jgi:hypothetical protein
MSTEFQEWQDTIFAKEHFKDVSRKKLMGNQADFLEGASYRVDFTSAAHTPYAQALQVLQQETRPAASSSLQPPKVSQVDQGWNMFGLFKNKKDVQKPKTEFRSSTKGPGFNKSSDE